MGHAGGQKFLPVVMMTGRAHAGTAQRQQAKPRCCLCPGELPQPPSIALLWVSRPPLHRLLAGAAGAEGDRRLAALGPHTRFWEMEKEVLLPVTSMEIPSAQWSHTGLVLRSKSDPE